MPKNLKHVGVVALSTMGSRVLGLVRDVLMFALLGASAVSSAFLLAFTLPNLFRRLLGEGALTSALVPVLAERLERDGPERAHALLNRLLTRLRVALLGIAVAAMVALALFDWLEGFELRWYRSAEFALWLMPYLVLVCLAAIVCAALNVHQRFAVAALSQVWLNLCMIASLLVGWYVTDAIAGRAWFLCAGVLLGGILQLLIPALDLRKTGWRYRPDFTQSDGLSEVWRLLLPGLAGAAIFQVNTAVSRLLAFFVSESATAILYLANRLVELPLGVFAIAVTTVVFPEIARAAGRGDRPRFAREFHHGLRLILAITIPASAGLALLSGPILTMLFAWGAFGGSDVAATTPVLVVYALGIPVYALATYLVRGFHAIKDMRTPVRLALLNLVLNLVFGLALMLPLGAVGLALANVLSMTVYTVLMARMQWRALPELSAVPVFRPALQFAWAATLMCVVAVGAPGLVVAFALGGDVCADKLPATVWVLVSVPLSVACYLGLLQRFKVPEAAELLQLVFRRK